MICVCLHPNVVSAFGLSILDCPFEMRGLTFVLIAFALCYVLEWKRICVNFWGFISVLPLFIQFSSEINRFNSAMFLCLSIARALLSIGICQWFLYDQWFEVICTWLYLFMHYLYWICRRRLLLILLLTNVDVWYSCIYNIYWLLRHLRYVATMLITNVGIC